MLTISGYVWAQWHYRDFSAVLTIENPNSYCKLRVQTPYPEHLILQFADSELTVASSQNIIDGLMFARNKDNLLIHCQFGYSRSPALALGILMERLGSEDAAYAELERLQPTAIPNRYVVAFIDQFLGSHLLAELDKWNSRNCWSVLRSLYSNRNNLRFVAQP
jgi:predicted protein tyrosine phosphatase